MRAVGNKAEHGFERSGKKPLPAENLIGCVVVCIGLIKQVVSRGEIESLPNEVNHQHRK